MSIPILDIPSTTRRASYAHCPVSPAPEEGSQSRGNTISTPSHLWEVSGTSVQFTQGKTDDSGPDISSSYELADERAFLKAVNRFFAADDDMICMDATEYTVVATDDQGTQYGNMLQYCSGKEQYINDLLGALAEA